MSGHDAALSEMERLAAFADAERTFQMTEDEFRLFYEETARPVWLYLARITGDRRAADDLLQETYYRFLRSRTPMASGDHRRNYLFRIATNLARDQHRRPQPVMLDVTSGDGPPAAVDAGLATRAAERIDVARALGRLKPRERSLLWLAYAQGWSHQEIALSLGLKAASLKVLLHRARRHLLAVLGEGRRQGDQS